MLTLLSSFTTGGGGGGHSGTEGVAPALRISRRKGYFFIPRYEVWVSKSPYNPRNTRGSDAE